MKTLLRSTFLSIPTDDADLSFRNYLLLSESGLGFDLIEDGTLWEFVRDFSRTHNHSPNIRSIRSHFESLRKPEPLDRLEVLSTLKPLYKGDFVKHLEDRAEERRTRQVIDLLREAGNIVQTGIEIQEGKNKRLIRGPIDAIRHLITKSHDIVMPTTGGRLSGEITMDGKDFLDECERIKNDPLAGVGQFTGIEQMDHALRGAKKYELWTHAAFTGGLKSTLALNWAYNQAVYMKYDSCFFSLEMPYIQCRRILYAMHSMHGKFKDVRIRMGIQKNPGPNVGIDYGKIRDGELSAAEYEFLEQYVVPDFNSGNYGRINLEVSDPDKSDFTAADVRSKAELIYSKNPFSILFLDHAGLLHPRKWVPSTTDRLNEVLRDLKRLAMNFNRGAGMAVVNLYQISREGFKSAEKLTEKSNGTYSQGPYNLTHLSYASECVVSGTKIPSSRGLVAIESLQVGDLVWSSSGWKRVLELFNQGVRPTWNLTTDRGSQLFATGNHRVRVLQGSHISWVSLDSICPGDYVLGSGPRSDWPTDAPVLPSMDGGPSVLTTDLAYLLGVWDGDGMVRPNGLGITGNRNEKSLIERISSAWDRCFSAPLKHYEFKSRPGSFDLMCHNTNLKKWFELVSGERGLVVPNAILHSPKKMALAYLQGLFDTDGWVNSQGVIGLKMKCEHFLRTIQDLLSSLGYDSHLSSTSSILKATGKSYIVWTLRLRGRDSLNLFSQEIGFTEDWKQHRVTNPVGVPKDKRMYPLAAPYLRLYGAAHPAGCPQTNASRSFYNSALKARKTGLVSHRDVQTLLSLAQEKGIHNSEFDLLKTISDLRVMRVVSISRTGTENQVWDIEVGGDHEYQSGPILSHNCERSSDIVTASFVDNELRAQNRVLFQCLKARDHAPFQNFFARVEWPCRRILTSHEVPMIQPTNLPSKKDGNKSTLDEISDLL